MRPKGRLRAILVIMAALALLAGTAPQATAAPVVSAKSAGTKTVGHAAYVWGTVSETGATDVWTEVQIDGRWSRSQTGRSDATGYFSIELTYGWSRPGVYRWRVGAKTASGTIFSAPFDYTRTPWTPGWAGSKPVGQTTYTWATMPRAANRSVWTEVRLASRWSRSQVTTANSSGYFSIPLTYGINTPGRYTYRVVASTTMGNLASQPFVLTRTAAAPAPDLVAKWRGKDIESFPNAGKVVALTFDGGADNTSVTRILSTLKSNGVPGTFFVTGQFARAYPSSVRAMAQAGHPVGNHSDTHPYFTKTSDARIRAELSAAESSITALTGKAAKPLFRFPYGDRTAYDIQVVNNAGYIPIRWTSDTLGWQGTSGGMTVAKVRQRVLANLKPGAIVLMHVGRHPTDRSELDADALQGIINDLRARGYGFTTVDKLLRN